MIFTTPEFVLFAVLFFGLYPFMRGFGRKAFLLAASYLFYACWDWRFLFLLWATTGVSFYLARGIDRSESQKKRKVFLGLALGFCLGELFLFKYCDFFIDSANALLAACGLGALSGGLHLVLPVGISFYVFQTLSYVIDVYKKEIRADADLLDFALYVAYFPQLVAGPIERAQSLLPQLQNLDAVYEKRDASGIGLIALGAFKKAVIADNLALCVDALYDPNVNPYPAGLWIGTLAFAIQIYCDFSGYSDIATGLSRLIGIDLMTNFESPYASLGPNEFWRRWHISLSTWLRDYLYFSLGGSRCSALKTARNILIVMALAGLWHGAGWNFVLWGVAIGTMQVIARTPPFKWLQTQIDLLPRFARMPARFLQHLCFLFIILLDWALFRCSSLEHCKAVFKGLFSFNRFNNYLFQEAVAKGNDQRVILLILLCCAGVMLFHCLYRKSSKDLVQTLWKAPLFVKVTVCILLLCVSMLYAPEAPPPFIYFQF